MKKIYLAAIAALSVIPFISNAQWTSGGSGNYYLNSGYALIGTTEPTSDITYKTEIYGSDHVLGLSGATNGIGQLVGIEFNQLTTAVATRPGGAIKSFASGSYTGGIGSTYNSDLAFYSAVIGMNTERMRILSNGKVGIGTTTPDELLSVLGKIHANEVKVDLSVPGPDYVFKPNYKLPTLAEVKNYVDKNHHLSEIPSADEMARNGLNLGDMNTKLLKKVEELTLYLIEKDRQVEEQRHMNQCLQLQLDSLKQQVNILIIQSPKK